MINNKEALIAYILKHKYGNDDHNNNSRTRDFLESLTLRELESLNNEDDEDEFDVCGEVTDFDFDIEEMNY